uniref:Uncharacterized protein n=1 Tax=Sphaerodactylus townsendi TaxID=933632 RepID=A0ACB8FG94_9SAUR
MGDTAAPQAPALLGAPRVHSAIVERLRARIAVCRQHHLDCAGRYERGRAETSEREREGTRHLLRLVQQQHGQAARKGAKHAKAAAAGNPCATAPPPADHYHQPLLGDGALGGRNGVEQGPAAGGEQRNPALVAIEIFTSDVLSFFCLDGSQLQSLNAGIAHVPLEYRGALFHAKAGSEPFTCNICIDLVRVRMKRTIPIDNTRTGAAFQLEGFALLPAHANSFPRVPKSFHADQFSEGCGAVSAAFSHAAFERLERKLFPIDFFTTLFCMAF